LLRLAFCKSLQALAKEGKKVVLTMPAPPLPLKLSPLGSSPFKRLSFSLIQATIRIVACIKVVSGFAKSH